MQLVPIFLQTQLLLHHPQRKKQLPFPLVFGSAAIMAHGSLPYKCLCLTDQYDMLSCNVQYHTLLRYVQQRAWQMLEALTAIAHATMHSSEGPIDATLPARA
jgi:hypothetical protein